MKAIDNWVPSHSLVNFFARASLRLLFGESPIKWLAITDILQISLLVAIDLLVVVILSALLCFLFLEKSVQRSRSNRLPATPGWCSVMFIGRLGLMDHHHDHLILQQELVGQCQVLHSLAGRGSFSLTLENFLLIGSHRPV